MATMKPVRSSLSIENETGDQIIEQDPYRPGRHHARLVEYGHHVWAIIGSLRRLNGNIAQTAAEWGLPEEVVTAASRYHDRHRQLFDAFFLLEREEFEAEGERNG